jgi:hypothetical protein
LALPAAADSCIATGSGAAGAPLTVGLDVVSGQDAGLRISSQSSVVTVRDLAAGTTETSIVPGDPALLNRKFSIRIRSTGEGGQLPIALPRIALGGVAIFPTLILQAASTDLSLDFTDRPEPADSTALQGRAPLYGMGFGLAAPLCPGCPWFASAGYRVSLLPELTAERSPAFEAPGFVVLQDQSRFRLRSDEGLLRIGRGLPGGRAAAYLGLLRGRDLVTDDDVVQLSSPRVGLQQLLSTRTRLAAETTAGLAGLEARLAGPLMLRLETVFGSGRSGGALKLAYLRLPPPPPPPPAPGRQDDAQERIARRILPRLAEIRAELDRRLASLPSVQPGAPGVQPGLPGAPPGPALPALVSAAAVAQLLDDVERQLLAALAEPELVALRDYVEDLFRSARQDLGLAARTGSAGAPAASLALASFRRPPASAASALSAASAGLATPAINGAPPAGRGLEARKVGFWACRIDVLVETIQSWARKRELQIDLIVESDPDHARFSMTPYSYRARPAESYRTDGKLMVIPGVWRGRYSYTVALGKDFQARQEEPLDLVQGSPRSIHCHLARRSDANDASSCDPRPQEADRRCAP